MSFTYPGHDPVAGRTLLEFPDLFGDEVLPGDADIYADKILAHDIFAVRADVIPQPGDMVLATGAKGERLRRLLVQVEGEMVLRPFFMQGPDISVYKVASIEGVICGFYREYPELDAVKTFFSKTGRMRVEHL